MPLPWTPYTYVSSFRLRAETEKHIACFCVLFDDSVKSCMLFHKSRDANGRYGNDILLIALETVARIRCNGNRC